MWGQAAAGSKRQPEEWWVALVVMGAAKENA